MSGRFHSLISYNSTSYTFLSPLLSFLYSCIRILYEPSVNYQSISFAVTPSILIFEFYLLAPTPSPLTLQRVPNITQPFHNNLIPFT